MIRDGKIPEMEDDYGLPWEYDHEAVFEPGASFETPGAMGPRPHWEEGDQAQVGPELGRGPGAGEWPNQLGARRFLGSATTTPIRPAFRPAREGDLQEAGGRRRPRGPGPVQGVSPLRQGLPLQEAVFQPPHRQDREVPPLLPQGREGRAAGLLLAMPGEDPVHQLGRPKSAVHKLVNEWKVALPLRPEFGTEPNVFYVPPVGSFKFRPNGEMTQERRIPLEYLARLFGGRRT